jgi:hypothetical protein
MVGPDAAVTAGANARIPAVPESKSSASAIIELAFEVFVIPIVFIMYFHYELASLHI